MGQGMSGYDGRGQVWEHGFETDASWRAPPTRTCSKSCNERRKKDVPDIGTREVEMDWKGIENMLKTFAHVAMAGLRAMLIVTIPFACVMGLALQSLKVFGGVILLGVVLWPFLTVMVSGVKLGWW